MSLQMRTESFSGCCRFHGNRAVTQLCLQNKQRRSRRKENRRASAARVCPSLHGDPLCARAWRGQGTFRLQGHPTCGPLMKEKHATSRAGPPPWWPARQDCGWPYSVRTAYGLRPGAADAAAVAAAETEVRTSRSRDRNRSRGRGRGRDRSRSRGRGRSKSKRSSGSGREKRMGNWKRMRRRQRRGRDMTEVEEET